MFGPEFYGHLTLALLGMLGQGVRAVLGILKAWEHDQKLNYKRTVATLISGFIGGALMGLLSKDPYAAFFTGLGSTDVLESLLKLK